nr:hypothetical protein [Prevotella sp.]
MITFQVNTRFSQALPCTREEFWEQVRKPSTTWRIDARRAIQAAVEASKTQGAAALHSWLQNADYQRFLVKKQGMKKQAAREAWQKKSDAEKLLAFAQTLKESLPAFIFACREFDETETAKAATFRHRRLADCHLNGLFMLDIDHIDNPMQVWYKLRDDEELMKGVALVHITSSSCGIRIVAKADINVGNIADNQIVLAQKLGYKADDSCIDATRNSFAPKEEDILFINEELLFNYYNEEFDKRFTPEYREKKTQPIRFQFDTDGVSADGACAQSHAVAAKAAEQGSGDGRTVDVPPVDNGVTWRGYDIQAIIDQRYAAKRPCAEDTNRHTESLKLATDLLLMLDGDKQRVLRVVEAQPWVQEIIAERDENVAQTVESAASCIAEREKKTATPMPSKAMQEAIVKATGKSYLELTRATAGDSEDSPESVAGINRLLNQWGAEIEALFPEFPLLRDVCTGLKRAQYPAAMFTAGGALMTLMTRCWYRFYHRAYQDRRLNCSLYIIGHPASNKSMADDICEALIAPISSADKAGKAALNRYKKET